jgi:DNA-binding transcriptional ArsR family regulator
VVLHGTDPYTWRRIVRRVKLGPSVKLVALTLSDYANPDGTSIRPGNERLSAVTELSDKTIRRALEKLRGMGLIERVFEGSRYGRRGLADEYRLTFDDDPEYVAEMLPVSELPGSPVLIPERTPVTSTGDVDGTPVTMTDGPVENGVDNPPPVAEGISGTPVTEVRTPVTEDGTPVTSSRNTGTGDRPPNQAPKELPTHLPPTNKQAGRAELLAEVEVSGPILVSSAEKNDLGSEDEAVSYPAAAAILQRMPGRFDELLAKAVAEFPDASYRRQAIEAARISQQGIHA